MRAKKVQQTDGKNGNLLLLFLLLLILLLRRRRIYAASYLCGLTKIDGLATYFKASGFYLNRFKSTCRNMLGGKTRQNISVVLTSPSWNANSPEYPLGGARIRKGEKPQR